MCECGNFAWELFTIVWTITFSALDHLRNNHRIKSVHISFDRSVKRLKCLSQLSQLIFNYVEKILLGLYSNKRLPLVFSVSPIVCHIKIHRSQYFWLTALDWSVCNMASFHVKVTSSRINAKRVLFLIRKYQC